MEIKLKEISVREVVENYVNNDEEGVIGYNGKLNIRPKSIHFFMPFPGGFNNLFQIILRNPS